MVKAGSGALTLGIPTSPGVPAALAEYTLTLEYNNIDQVREVLSGVGSEVACIIVEPVAGNMNCIPPVDGFLQGLRTVCDEHGIVLIFDEVMTGFRVALGGAQAYYDVKPDLTTLGKVIGGVCRWVLLVVSVKLCNILHPLVRCTKPAHSRAIQCQCRQVWPC